jgi:hypothetical protein
MAVKLQIPDHAFMLADKMHLFAVFSEAVVNPSERSK